MSDRPKPWARAIALLMACYVTLIGMWSRLDPETILTRALGAALLTGVAVRLGLEFVNLSRKWTRTESDI